MRRGLGLALLVSVCAAALALALVYQPHRAWCGYISLPALAPAPAAPAYAALPPPPVPNSTCEEASAEGDPFACSKAWFRWHEPVRFFRSGAVTHDVRGWFEEGGAAPVPIFVITKDRLVDLQEALHAMHRYLRTPFEVVLHDEGSTYAPMRRYLDALAAAGVPVYRAPAEGGSIETISENVGRTVAAHLARSGSAVYVVTDPDVALDNVPPNLLAVYEALLGALGVDCVGAALRWDDWPEEIQRMGFELGQLRPAELFEWRGRPVYFVRFPVDTTFAMYHRRAGPWRRFGQTRRAVRVLPPFAARHLDFYFVPGRVPPDLRHYLNRSDVRAVTHMHHLHA